MSNEKRLIDAYAVQERLRKRREDFASAWRTFDSMPDGAKSKYEENLHCSLIIDGFPAVDAVEVVHGDWRLGKFNSGRETVFAECSVCDAVFEVSSFTLGLNYNYCPNCGAKMDGGNDT